MMLRSCENSLFIVFAVVSIFGHQSNAIRCYTGVGRNYNSDSIENCSGNCMKIIRQEMVSRGCSGVKGGEVCDAAPYLTVCYCKTDLCNKASQSPNLTLYSVLSALGVLLFWKIF